jgi:hypothetical protein
MDFDQRDEVWDAVWGVYYNTYFQEVLAERLVLRWQRFNEASKVLIALTASGSALSGWALWSDPGFKVLWALLAGIGAILAIVHKSLDVSGKLFDWGSSRSQFSIIRIDFQKLINRLRINPRFAIKESTAQLDALTDRYSEAYKQTKMDAFLTGKLRISVQEELNSLVASNQS